jgi:hypothetical protein
MVPAAALAAAVIFRLSPGVLALVQGSGSEEPYTAFCVGCNDFGEYTFAQDAHKIGQVNSRLRLIFYAVLMVAISLRFHAINAQSFWLDELWSIEIANGHDADHQLMPVDQILNHPPDLTRLAAAAPIWRVWTGMDRVTGPPGFYILLRIWMTMFGQTETSLRMMSAVLSMAALIILFLAVRISIGPEPAIWAAMIFAVAEPQIHYAQDARPYALLMFLGSIAILSVVKIAATGPSLPRSIALTLSGFCLILTHYFAISVLLAIGIYAVLGTSDRARKNILICLSIVLLVYAFAWGPLMLRQLPRFSTTDRGAAFLLDKAPDHLRQTCWRLLTLPMSMLCDIRPIPRWYAIGGFVYVFGAYLSFGRKIHLLWPMLYASVIGLLAALDLIHSTAHLSFIRYGLLASLPVYAVLAASTQSSRIFGRIICGAVVLYCAISLPHAYVQTNEDFRSFGAAISASTQKGDLIIFAGPADTYAPQIQGQCPARSC